MSSTYFFWLVRYVPDVARGERVNVAVIAGRDEGDWDVRVAPDLRKAARIGGDATALRAWLGSLEEAIRDYAQPPLDLFGGHRHERVSRAWLELLSHRFNNVLQVSDAAPVIAESAADAAAFLYDALVSVDVPARRSRTRTRIAGDLTDLYRNLGGLDLGRSILRRPAVRIGRQRGRFEHAIVGDHVAQLTQVFAFDVRDADLLEQEVQSWNYIVSRLRDDGADLRVEERVLHAELDVPVAVAYQEPSGSRRDARHEDVFEAAREAWSALDILAVPSSDLGQIVRAVDPASIATADSRVASLLVER